MFDIIDVKEREPEKDGFYPTNVGVLYFEGVWFTPTQYQGWEPDQNDSVTHWMDIPQTIRKET